MSTSKDFPNHRESACAAPLDKVSAQRPRHLGMIEGGEELVGGSSSPPFPDEPKAQRGVLSSRQETERRRLEASSLCGMPDEMILRVGEELAGELGAQGETFFIEPASNKDPDVAARGCHIALGQSFLALQRKGKYTRAAHRSEYRKIVGYPSDVGPVLSKKVSDHDRGRGHPLRTYQKRLEEFAPSQDSYYDEPFPGLEAALSVQNWLALLSPKERLAFRRMIQHEPIANDSERLTRQRVRKKIKRHLAARAEWRAEHERKDALMGATIANDLADLKLGQRMQGETLDEILRGVETLRARDLEAVNDEDQEDAA